MAIIDETYLPFSVDDLRDHFIGDCDAHLEYYQQSAKRYHQFTSENPIALGTPLTKSKYPRQIEKDERFWTITATKTVYDHPSGKSILAELPKHTYSSNPPLPSFTNWKEYLDGDLRLYFEVRLPSPPSYVSWLHSKVSSRHIVPYVHDAAGRENNRTLEGPTHVDAMFINLSNGFAWLIEAKVLSDISYMISFDIFRNQIIRNMGLSGFLNVKQGNFATTERGGLLCENGPPG